MFLTRRTALALTVAACMRPSALWSETISAASKPFGWSKASFGGRTYFIRGTSDRCILLLHEINGLSPGCVDLGVNLVDQGFTVLMPLLFGHPMQDSVAWGGIESCALGGFHCLSNGGRSWEPEPVRWTQTLVANMEKQTEIRSIGVIGMCQSGAYPLATMVEHSKVKAVIMSQPALPFGRTSQENVGLSASTMEVAKKSRTPILGFRFQTDRICKELRFRYLKDFFGAQFQSREFDCPDQKMSSSHRLHAVLTGQCTSVREEARGLTAQFFRDHLS